MNPAKVIVGAFSVVSLAISALLVSALVIVFVGLLVDEVAGWFS
jgi:hypothetical protein